MSCFRTEQCNGMFSVLETNSPFTELQCESLRKRSAVMKPIVRFYYTLVQNGSNILTILLPVRFVWTPDVCKYLLFTKSEALKGYRQCLCQTHRRHPLLNAPPNLSSYSLWSKQSVVDWRNTLGSSSMCSSNKGRAMHIMFYGMLEVKD